MNVVVEFCMVTCKVLWAFVSSGVRWIVRPKEKDVSGQVCIITGGGSGLGRLFAIEFARRGATVVLWDINPLINEETAEMVRFIHRHSSHGEGNEDESLCQTRVYAYECDVSKPEDVYLTAEKVQRETTKAFLPKMLEMNKGHIVTVASSLGLFTTAGVEDYCASKFGAVGFHESLSHELKAAEKEGIKMTLVCPFLVDTRMFMGCRIRKELAPMFPPLKAEQCVKQAMRAILTDQPMICTPRTMYIVTFMKTILPFDAIVCMYRFLGADKCMYPFLARRTDIMNNNQAKSE